MLIDFSKVTEIELHLDSFYNYDRNVWINLSRLILMATNLSSLIIVDPSCYLRNTINIEYLLSIIPPRIKHLRISLKNLDFWEAIIQKCSNLMWVDVEFNRKSLRRQFVAWCNDNTSNSTYKIWKRKVSVWFGIKRKQAPYRMETRNKRIKLCKD